MGLNIKNEGVYAAVRQLADVLGVSQTSAVEVAVREKLAAMDSERDRLERAARIRSAVARWQDVPGMDELSMPDFLYDPETGMPR